MTENKFITNNSLIAEFIGFKSVEVPFDMGCKYLEVPPERQKQAAEESKKYFYEGNPYSPYSSFYPKEMRFHYSWDWLMPVVEKIESMGYRTTLFCHEYGKEDGNSMHIKDSSHTMLGDGFASTKIEAVYKAVVEFIKWYNENKKA